MAEFQLGYEGPEVQLRRTLVKKDLVLDPLIGVGPIRFGMSRETVLAALGPSTSTYYAPTESNK